MRSTFLAVLCLTVVLAGCKAKELADKADISKDLAKRGTTDLMKEVADDSYDPPADGKLTDAQVRMYLKVREHEKKIAQVAKEEATKHAEKSKKAGEKSFAGMMEGFKTLGSVADMMTADLRAAKDLGYNSQEYVWVKQQILEVSTTAMAEKMTEAMSANFDQAYDQAKKAHDEATDEATKKMYAEMLATYDQSRKEFAEQQKQNENSAVAHNRRLLAKYENEMNAFAQELAKWEDKPGEVQKAMDDYQKQVEQAKKKQ